MTKEEPQLRQITREDIEFLAALQNEMNTQPHVGQADPRFWVVMTHRLHMTLRDEDIENAVKDLTVSLLFLAHLFGVSGVTVTITRGDSDE